MIIVKITSPEENLDVERNYGNRVIGEIRSENQTISDFPVKNFLTDKTLPLSIHNHLKNVLNTLGAGVSGNLIKDFTIAKVVEAIRQVISNETYLCHTATQLVIKRYQQWSAPQHVSSLPLTLTARERGVIAPRNREDQRPNR